MNSLLFPFNSGWNICLSVPLWIIHYVKFGCVNQHPFTPVPWVFVCCCWLWLMLLTGIQGSCGVVPPVDRWCVPLVSPCVFKPAAQYFPCQLGCVLVFKPSCVVQLLPVAWLLESSLFIYDSTVYLKTFIVVCSEFSVGCLLVSPYSKVNNLFL